jgi:hypothetical protein
MSALNEDRRRAIEQSGFGEEFHLVQPQNAPFWVYGLSLSGASAMEGFVSRWFAALEDASGPNAVTRRAT